MSMMKLSQYCTTALYSITNYNFESGINWYKNIYHCPELNHAASLPLPYPFTRLNITLRMKETASITYTDHYIIAFIRLYPVANA